MSRSTPDYHIPDSREWTDIAVVGLGAAGAFAADQLTKGWVSKRIKVIAYEAQSRVGGRLLSPQLPRVADASNLGAMRADDAHKLVKSCSDDVGVALDTFDLSNLTAWRVRGKIFHAGHETPLKTYTLRDDVLALAITDPGDLIRYVTLRTLAATDFPDLSGPERTAALDWQKQVLEALDFKHAKPQPFSRDGWPYFISHGRLQIDGQPSVLVRDIGFSNLLVHYLGSEGFDCIRDTLGFDSVPGNWNAAAAIAWFADDFGADIVWRTPHGGFQELPKRLVDRFMQSGGVVRLGYRLVRLDKDDDGTWHLLFTQRDESTGRVREHETIAKHVILGLPPKSLQELQVGYAGWDNTFVQNKLDSVQQQRMFKAIMVYPSSWWDSQASGLPGGRRGRVLTNSSLRQVYYFGSPAGGATQGLPSLMVYSDCQHVDYWATFLHSADAGQGWDTDRDEQIQCYERYFASRGDELSSDERLQLQKIKQYIMPQRMLYKMRDLLAELHGVPQQDVKKDEYLPLLGIYQGWGLDSLNVGGWHTWRIGACPEDLVDKILQPFPDEQLYIVGEAYSRYQGWVEGALDSASSAVERLKQHVDDHQTLGSRFAHTVREALRHVVPR